LKARLAKGEITIEQFNQMKAAISGDSAAQPTEPAPPAKKSKWKQYLIIAFVVFCAGAAIRAIQNDTVMKEEIDSAHSICLARGFGYAKCDCMKQQALANIEGVDSPEGFRIALRNSGETCGLPVRSDF
jgi:hypothetical protein